MPKNILVTGITGSGGSYLAEYILENHPEVNVYGICRWHSTGTMANINGIQHKIKVIECDLLDFSSIVRALRQIKPYRIFHLAAFANVRKCFDTPLSVVHNNVMGTANLLEAVRIECPDALIQICSTSEVYGNPQNFPMTEDHPLVPVNPYSVSKLAQERLAYAYFKSWGLRIIITRMFAYINPRRRDLFASAFAYQIAEMELWDRLGAQYDPVIKHGNLDSIRTIIDVRDAMEAYWVACDFCQAGEAYNIGGIYTNTVGNILEILKSKSKVLVSSMVDPNLLRPVDVTKQVPDTTKFDTITGWRPKYSIDESIEFLLDHARKEFL